MAVHPGPTMTEVIIDIGD